ncbi:hypothetical protein SLA2020_313730 [Shorea laevis]
MEEKVDLLGSNKGKESAVAEDSAPLHDLWLPWMPLPPQAPRPKLYSWPKPTLVHQIHHRPSPHQPCPVCLSNPNLSLLKTKTKVLGPIPKETKNNAQKPYDLPLLPKKQNIHIPKMLPSIQPPLFKPFPGSQHFG